MTRKISCGMYASTYSLDEQGIEEQKAILSLMLRTNMDF
jgi:hypothetical protein